MTVDVSPYCREDHGATVELSVVHEQTSIFAASN